MQARQFEQLLDRLDSLTRRQRAHLLALLQSAAGLERVLDVIEQPAQRRACSRPFNALTGTPLARLRHKAHWLNYLDSMLDSRSVRRAQGC